MDARLALLHAVSSLTCSMKVAFDTKTEQRSRHSDARTEDYSRGAKAPVPLTRSQNCHCNRDRIDWYRRTSRKPGHSRRAPRCFGALSEDVVGDKIFEIAF